MGLALSAAAAGLLRALLARAGIARDRILLSAFESVEWQSLMFVGERHEITLRIPGPDAAAVAARLTDGLADAEFAISGQIVADIALSAPVEPGAAGAITVRIEALTIAE